MNNIPQVETKVHVQAMLKLMKWFTLRYRWHTFILRRIRPTTVLIIVGISSDGGKDALNFILRTRWDDFTSTQQAQIRAICGDKETT